MSKTIKTVPGKMYAVECANACTVTNSVTGVVACTTTAGAQGAFVATSGEYELSDDSAVVVATFNVAIRKLRLLADGGEKENLPSGYKRLEYIEANGKQKLLIDIPTTTQDISFELEYQFTNSTDRQLSGFDASSGYFGVNEGQWENSRRLYAPPPEILDKVTFKGALNKELYVDSLSLGLLRTTHNGKIGIVSLANESSNWFLLHAKLYAAKIYANGELLYDLIPVEDDGGDSCLYDKVHKTTHYSILSGFVGSTAASGVRTWSLRRPVAEWAKKTAHGVRRLYRIPDSYTGDPEQYIEANGFKRLVENEMPEDGYWEPVWRETDTELVLDWREVEPPVELENTPEILTDTTQQ